MDETESAALVFGAGVPSKPRTLSKRPLQLFIRFELFLFGKLFQRKLFLPQLFKFVIITIKEAQSYPANSDLS
jgi:hypothetical protein